VFCGEWCIGRIYEQRSGPKELRWFWALHAPGGRETLRASNRVATLEGAKAESEASWKGMEGVGEAEGDWVTGLCYTSHTTFFCSSDTSLTQLGW
jgi:hypothetical protein